MGWRFPRLGENLVVKKKPNTTVHYLPEGRSQTMCWRSLEDVSKTTTVLEVVSCKHCLRKAVPGGVLRRS
jgi:hypothetical protein